MDVCFHFVLFGILFIRYIATLKAGGALSYNSLVY